MSSMHAQQVKQIKDIDWGDGSKRLVTENRNDSGTLRIKAGLETCSEAVLLSLCAMLSPQYDTRLVPQAGRRLQYHLQCNTQYNTIASAMPSLPSLIPPVLGDFRFSRTSKFLLSLVSFSSSSLVPPSLVPLITVSSAFLVLLNAFLSFSPIFVLFATPEFLKLPWTSPDLPRSLLESRNLPEQLFSGSKIDGKSS